MKRLGTTIDQRKRDANDSINNFLPSTANETMRADTKRMESQRTSLNSVKDLNPIRGQRRNSGGLDSTEE